MAVKKQASNAKEKQTEAEALYLVSITFLYSLVPHPQILIGEGLLASGSFVLLIDHLASFTRPSHLARSWGLASHFFIPFLLFFNHGCTIFFAQGYS